ncbi:MAG: hypothetical protein E6771_14860 [Fusobacterium sp.]|nr:hypothetical protein [Fusobacterium sp.]
MKLLKHKKRASKKEVDLFAILLPGRDFYIANIKYTNIKNEKLKDLLRLSRKITL